MSAIRCQECRAVFKEDNGYCPECGAMYQEAQWVDEAMLSQEKPAYTAPPLKKKGLFSSLFGAGKAEDDLAHATRSSEPVAPSVTLSAEELASSYIRCKECQSMEPADSHGDYCNECGAFFTQPFDFVTQQSIQDAKAREQAEAEALIPVDKNFDEMEPAEQLDHLKEQIADIYDDIIKQRFVMNEKANECMQCFTAAGTLKSQNEMEVMASMLKQRRENLKPFEVVFIEYQRMLAKIEATHQDMVAAQHKYAEHEALLKSQGLVTAS